MNNEEQRKFIMQRFRYIEANELARIVNAIYRRRDDKRRLRTDARQLFSPQYDSDPLLGTMPRGSLLGGR